MEHPFWDRWRRISPIWGAIFLVVAVAGWWNWYRESGRLHQVCDEIGYLRDYSLGDRSVGKMADRCIDWFAEDPYFSDQ